MKKVKAPVNMRNQESNKLFHTAVRMIDAHPQQSVDDICEELKVSTRHLRRLFRKNMGMSPKQYLRIKRFHKAIRIAFSADSVDFQKIVFHCGYYDQSHFCKDVKEFTGKKPIDFFKQEVNLLFMNENLASAS